MKKSIDLFDILSKSITIRETAEMIFNIIKSNPKAEFDVKIHNLAIDEEIIILLAEILHRCEQQGSQVELTGSFSTEVLSRIVQEKCKIDCKDIKTEGRVIDPGQVIDAEY